MDRRSFLAGLVGAGIAAPAAASLASTDRSAPTLRGTLGDDDRGLITGSTSQRSRTLQRLLDEASTGNRQIFLPPGDYVVSDIVLPPRTRLAGVPGATRLVFGGGDHMIAAHGADHVSLTGLVIDGAGLASADYVPGLVHIAETADVTIDDCVIENSGAAGLALDRCAGRVNDTVVRGAAAAGIRAVESTGLVIAGNTVEDCGDGGILVYRWSAGEDGTLVSGNRIARIRADSGGNGPNGNGISIFRADGVVVTGNRVAACAFSAIRAASAGNVQITGNTCLQSGETALYVEFVSQGAVVNANLIDGAANGISVVNYREGGRLAAVTGNVVRNLRREGPQGPDFGTGISVEADTAVTGNTVENAPRFGLLLGYGPYLRDVAATGNVIRNAGIGIGVSVVEGAGTAVISGNLISGARQGAVVGMRWEEPASGDLTATGAETFGHLQIDRNRVS